LPHYVDTHCHLDHHDELAAADQVARAMAQDVRTMITVGTDMASSTQAVRTAHRFDGVWAVVGIHPNDTMEATPHVLEVIDRLAEEDVVVGIGETGLDYYRHHTTPAQQEASFRAHIDLARKHDKTLVIHCRDAWDDCLKILADHGAPSRVVMHCFSGDEAVVDQCAEHRYYLSFAGNVTFRNAQPLRDAAARAPLDLLLTETDSPFLTPHPHRGERNDPSFLPLVAAELATVHGVDVDVLAATVAAKTPRMCALPDSAAQAKAS
jgi:TatD DNase family protein